MKKGNHSNRNRIEIYLFIYNNKTTKKKLPKNDIRYKWNIILW